MSQQLPCYFNHEKDQIYKLHQHDSLVYDFHSSFQDGLGYESDPPMVTTRPIILTAMGWKSFGLKFTNTGPNIGRTCTARVPKISYRAVAACVNCGIEISSGPPALADRVVGGTGGLRGEVQNSLQIGRSR